MKISRRRTFNGRRADVLTRPDTEGTDIFPETQGSPISNALTQKCAWPTWNRWQMKLERRRIRAHQKPKRSRRYRITISISAIFSPIDGGFTRRTNDRRKVFVILPRKISQFGGIGWDTWHICWHNRRYKSRVQRSFYERGCFAANKRALK